jgi:hypothetical protein
MAQSDRARKNVVSDKKKAILLRIAPELWEQLNRWAADEMRSLNAQIEYVLRQAARKRGGQAPGDEPAASSSPAAAASADDSPSPDSPGAV